MATQAAEFLLEPGSVPVLVVQPQGPTFAQVLARLGRDPHAQIVECATPMEAVSLARKLEVTLIFGHIANNDDVVKIVTLLRMLTVSIKKKRVRVVLTTKIKADQVLSTLAHYGCTEVLVEPSPEKSIFFKLDRQLKLSVQLLNSLQKPSAAKKDAPAAKLEAVPAPGTPTAGPTGASASEKNPVSPSDPARMSTQIDPSARTLSSGSTKKKFSVFRRAPIVIRSDFWLTADAEAKRIRGRWIVRLLGPGNEYGRWLRVKESKDPLWQWTPASPKDDPFVVDEGAWFFKGARPELQGLEWLFIGENPELAFRRGPELLATKMAADQNGDLVLAKDSEAGLALRPQIEESLNSMVRKRRHAADEKEDETGDPAQIARRRAERARNLALAGEEKVRGTPTLSEGPPLSLKSDCWLSTSRKPRRVAAQWMIPLRGPSPAHGRWVACEKPSPGPDCWKWLPLDAATDPFIKDRGAWIFRGLLPRFQEDAWLLVSEAPELAFHADPATSVAPAKFSSDADHNLSFAKDSQNALDLVPALDESLRRVLRSRKESESEEEDLIGAGSGLGEDEDDEVHSGKRAARNGRESSREDDLEPGSADESSGDSGGSRSRYEEAEESSESHQSSRELSLSRENSTNAENSLSSGSSGEEGHEYAGELHGDREGNELSAESGDRKLHPELSAETEGPRAGKELAAEQAGAKLGAELAAEQSGASPGAELSGKFSEPQTPGFGGEFPAEPDKAPGIHALHPPGPTLSPLALAFLISELVCRPGSDRAQIAGRYCAYVTASCGGLRVELWTKVKGQWTCLGTPDRANARYGAAVSSFEGEVGFRPIGAGEPAQALVAPVRLGEQVVGAIAIGGAGVEGVKPDYARAVARLTVGLLKAA